MENITKEQDTQGRIVKRFLIANAPYYLGQKEQENSNYQDFEKQTLQSIREKVEEESYRRGYEQACSDRREENSRFTNSFNPKDMQDLMETVQGIKKEICDLLLSARQAGFSSLETLECLMPSVEKTLASPPNLLKKRGRKKIMTTPLVKDSESTK